MSKKKTHEEYVAEVAIKNPSVEVIGKYINANAKITHHCLIHDIYWDTTPSRILQGVGCEKCKKEKFHNKTTRTHQQYVDEIRLINPTIDVIGTYIDSKTPILHKCNIHNIEWMTMPENVLNGHGCSECGKEKIKEKLNKTHEQYVREVKDINPNIKVIGNYINAYTPILHKCIIDDYEWNTSPVNILSGTSCPKCAGNMQKTLEDHIYELSLYNPNIEVVGEYINARTKTLYKCKIDGYTWEAYPHSVIGGTGCPKCAGNIKRTHDEYVEILSFTNSDIEVIGTYINCKTPILHKCKVDGYEWEVSPSVMLQNGSCPVCKETSGERQIRQWLEKHSIAYVFQYKFDNCRDINPLPFDFYLPDYNMVCEYDGIQHYKSIEYFGGEKTFKYTQKHDNIKNEYCKNNNIILLRIPYFKNVEEELNNFLFI